MFCRNCSNEVNDKAIACPQCGVNPRSEKKFCPSCGTATQPNQVLCTNCGVSLASTNPLSFDTSSLQNIDVNGLLKNKSLIFSAIALIGFFLTWIKQNHLNGGRNYSGANLSDLLDSPQVDSILSAPLLYLFPLALIGIVLSDFIPQITKYKKLLVMASLGLIIYAAIGIFTIKLDISEGMAKFFGDEARNVFSAGFGFYVSLIATLAAAFFSGVLAKK